MAGSVDLDKRRTVTTAGIILPATSMTSHKGGGHEPPDVFCGLASLIVEGRVPRPCGGKDGRDVYHGEGPHALRHHGPGGNIFYGHECSDDDYMCKKDDNFRKHMLLLWQNNVPVSIEVLLCSNCRVGKQKANSLEYSTIPESGSILLEQWTVSISNNFKRQEQRTIVGVTTSSVSNCDQHAITSRGLFQAVRSYLHFSQLSAWYDSSRGTEPTNVLYRITIPGEAFASKFTCQPEQHYFPPAAVGSVALVNVAVRSYPRTDKIPRVICTHNITTDAFTHSPTGLSSSPTSADVLGSDSSSTSASPTGIKSGSNGDQLTVDSKAVSPTAHTAMEENKLAMAGALAWKETECLETDLRRMTLVKSRLTDCTRSDSMDSMLGDSLLDPPQDLQKMPPKRYQSPSRCGSPSIEAPDHLLFGSHYHMNESASNNPQLYSTVGTDAINAESARNRLARQDLLRRRDIGLTLGISGSCHGLHPRMLHNIGQNQARLSLPPKVVGPISIKPNTITGGPYRAFPPERGMQQLTPFVQRTPFHSVVSKCCDIYSEANQHSPFAGRTQVKCNISGKHICKNGANGAEYDISAHAINPNSYEKSHHEKQHYEVEDTFCRDIPKKQDDMCNDQQPLPIYSNNSRPLTESTSSFILGGAKKKTAIAITQPHPKHENQIPSPISTCNRHYNQPGDLESDEDETGIEVAEYDIKDINKTLLSRNLTSEPTKHQNYEHQTIAQKELDNILDGLASEKVKCSSRRSSLKDEDSLFPHRCKCTTGSSQSKIDLCDLGYSKPSIPVTPIITKVYRAETETPPLVSSPTIHTKSSNRGGRTNSPVPPRALEKADILLGAILRTCERNRHLEKEEELSSDGCSSSREDNCSIGVTRQSPDERKNSAGDADDEQEEEEGENTSSDNGSSILSSTSSTSDEEETHFEKLKRSADTAHWYKHRPRNVQNRGRRKKLVPDTFLGRKVSDTSSSSMCSAGKLRPSATSSMNKPNLSLGRLSSDQFPQADYLKSQNTCDMEEDWPNSHQSSLCEDNKINSMKKSDDDKINTTHIKAISNRGDNVSTEVSHHSLIQEPNKFNNDNFLPEPDISNIMRRVKPKDSHNCQGGSDIANYVQNPNKVWNSLQRSGVAAARTSDNFQLSSSEIYITHNKTVSEASKHCKGPLLEPLDMCFNDKDNKTTLEYDFTSEENEGDVRNSKLDYEDQDDFMKFRKGSVSKSGTTNDHTKEATGIDAVPNSINYSMPIPTMVQKDSFRKTLNSATSMVFHRQSGLPLSSSPAPLRKGKHDFGYDSSINTPTDIKRALYQTQATTPVCSTIARKQINTRKGTLEFSRSDNDDDSHDVEELIGTGEFDEGEGEVLGGRKKKKRQVSIMTDDDIYPFSRKRHASFKSNRTLSASAPATVSTQGPISATNLLGTFEESVLNGRLEPVSTVEGFTAEIGASGSFHPKHKTVPVTVFFYTMCCDNSPSISSPYLGHINLGKKGYRVPQSGTIQVTLFNPLGTVVKMFVVMYNLSDMPANSQTFLRQRTFYMPTSESIYQNDSGAVKAGRDGSLPMVASQKWLRYLIHLRFASSKSGKIYLHTDVRMIIFRKSDLDTAADHNTTPGKMGGFELRSFTKGPSNPKFSPRKINFRQEE